MSGANKRVVHLRLDRPSFELVIDGLDMMAEHGRPGANDVWEHIFKQWQEGAALPDEAEVLQ